MYSFLKDKRVLYIEDEDDIRQNVTELLSDYFHTFDTASSGEEGYEKFLTQKVDIVIVDIELPKMNGIELLQKIRDQDKDIHLVVISAHTKTEYLLGAIPFKLEQYIVKPLNSRKVRELLTNLDEAFSTGTVIELIPNVIFNRDRAIVSFENQEHPLTKKEQGILSILADKKVISYDEIDELWGNEIPTSNAVRTCIKKLRQKLPDNTLKTRTGFGYYVE
ncbi:MAG: response regulator transcription factor [Epsilonproteobacteria bacterium]|nr:response regulator transcription factor [Campylobacterota bacterium]